MKRIILALSILASIGCTNAPTTSVPGASAPLDNTPVAPAETTLPANVNGRISLYWENTTEAHPERKVWSDSLTSEIDKNFQLFDNAKDTTSFCPNYKSLNKDQKIKAFGELFVGLSYYESGFNPKSYSVDVGNKNNKETWSVGLFQMSGIDGSAQVYKANFDTLQDPIVNIKVAVEQFKRQITKTGLFYLPNSSPQRYYATILVGNKYSKISEINSRVLKYAPACK